MQSKEEISIDSQSYETMSSKNPYLNICYVMEYAVQVEVFTKTSGPTLLLSENVIHVS